MTKKKGLETECTGRVDGPGYSSAKFTGGTGIHIHFIKNQGHAQCRECITRYKRFSECAMDITKLDWLNIVEIYGVTKTRIDYFGFRLPKFAHYLHTLGEGGTIKTGKVGKQAIVMQHACSLGTPTIMKAIATVCGIQSPMESAKCAM